MNNLLEYKGYFGSVECDIESNVIFGKLERITELSPKRKKARGRAATFHHYWRMSGTTTLNNALSNKRLAQAGYFDISQKYKSLHLCD